MPSKRHDQLSELSGVIYFVTDGEFVKVGFSTDFPSRLKAIQGHCARELQTLTIVDGPKGGETRLHRLLARARVHGEWYRQDNPLVRSVISRASGVTEFEELWKDVDPGEPESADKFVPKSPLPSRGHQLFAQLAAGPPVKLAKALDIDHALICRLRSAARRPSLDLALYLSDKLDIPPEAWGERPRGRA